MRYPLVIIFAALSTGGCFTHSTLMAAEEHPSPTMQSSRLLRCRVAHDEAGTLHLALTLRTRERENIEIGDAAWFEAHPQAELYKVAVTDGRDRRVTNCPVQLGNDEGFLDGGQWRPDVDSEMHDRVLVIVDPRPERELVAEVYWPQGLQIDATLGEPAGRLREPVPFGGRLRNGLKRYGIRALLPLSAAADAALLPLYLSLCWVPHC